MQEQGRPFPTIKRTKRVWFKKRPQKKDFFENIIDKIMSLNIWQWMIIVSFILLIIIWAVGGMIGLLFSLALATITFFMGAEQKKKRG